MPAPKQEVTKSSRELKRRNDKIYRQKYNQELKEKNKLYRIKNRERIRLYDMKRSERVNERRRQQITCPNCGEKISKGIKYSHIKTEKCLKLTAARVTSTTS